MKNILIFVKKNTKANLKLGETIMVSFIIFVLFYEYLFYINCLYFLQEKSVVRFFFLNSNFIFYLYIILKSL